MTEFSTLAADELSVVNNSDNMPVGVDKPVFAGLHTQVPEIISILYVSYAERRNYCLVIYSA
jgi:hypothetical protein